MPLKKSTRTKTMAPARSSASAKRPAASPAPAVSPETAPDTGRMMGAGAVLLVVCVMAAAMLLAARESAVPSTKTASAMTEPETGAASGDVSVKVPAPSGRTTATPSNSAAAKSASPKSSTVTITGCLQRGGESFRLTDTDGSDAPRARSWKTGFLKKGPAVIELTDAANRLRMASHVGQRVSVTGLLEDRQMQARSLRRIAPACE